MDNNAREMAKLMKLIRQTPNRLCADCDAALTDPSNVWCSITYGAFICVNCVSVHRQMGVHISRVRSVHLDNWTEKEIENLSKMGNQRVNEIYERYVPPSWTKATPDAERTVREQWIRAKYEAKMFTLPHLSDQQGFYQPSPTAQQSTLPVRLVDYFVLIGIGRFQQLDQDVSSCSCEELRFDPQILDCLPDADSYKDAPLPEHVGQFAFPEGLTLSAKEGKPFFFTFVLTNAMGLKMYGSTLIVYEEIERPELVQRLCEPGSSQRSTSNLPHWLVSNTSSDASVIQSATIPMLFAPKALTLLSHYPFYNLYREFLQQLYRISLSPSPIPIERYIVNFIHEIPLPPNGQIEVQFALPDRTLNITRPPKNQLPMVDFSYRPLFTLLSVDNIITTCSCLLLECKVVICCRNYSLLTPVTEALISLLFPFLWQGAFIPVMPMTMTDFLEAPVPFLVGIDSAYLMDTASQHRPNGVIFVNLDDDTVYLGTDDDGRQPRQLPQLPEREHAKLRQKLVEFGGCIYSPRNSSILSQAGVAFPGNEHLMPIHVFATEQGILQHTQAKDSSAKKSLRGHFSQRRSQYKQSSNRSLSCCTRSSSPDNSILSSSNNESQGKDDNFSAFEIRGAFLRFFVSIFRHYQTYVAVVRQGGPFPATLFQRDAFLRESSHLNDSSHPFMEVMLQSQMFERFLEERVTRPDLPEIRFFDESIVEKMNRSKTSAKRDTPFLNDTSDDVTETYVPQLPSNWGLPADSRTYSYTKFPHLNRELMGNIRTPRRLMRVAEQRRIVNTSMIRPITNPAAQSAGERRLSFTASLATTRIPYDRSISCITKAQSLVRMNLASRRYKKYRTAVIHIQRWWRHAECGTKDRLMYCEIIRRVKAIQRAYRIHRARIACIRRRSALLKLQARVRGFVHRQRYRKIMRSIVLIQSKIKGWLCVRAFRIIKSMVVKAQALYRGWMHRKRAMKERSLRLKELRSQMFALWKLAHTSLVYRSRFWWVFDGTGFLHIAVHEDELKKLWGDLGLYALFLDEGLSFAGRFRCVQDRLAAGTLGLADGGSAWHSPGDDATSVSASAAGLSVGVESLQDNYDYESIYRPTDVRPVSTKRRLAKDRETVERKRLYEQLKKHTAEGVKVSLFRLFGLADQRKRKRQLAQVVWQNYDRAGESAQVVISIFGVEMSSDWVVQKREQRIRSDVLDTVRACLTSLQGYRKRNRRISKKTSNTWNVRASEKYLRLSTDA